MAADRGSLLTEDEALLEGVMWEVVAWVQDAGFVLKGGGALVRAYGLDRHSTDLDFDAVRPTDLNRRIRRAAKVAGVVIDEKSWWSPKPTGRIGVSRRLKVAFVAPNGHRQRLQIDTRFKPKPKTGDIVVVNEIRTYKPEAIYSQKLDAIKDRRVARDIFDLAFLTQRYGDALSDDQIRNAETVTRDMDGLERKLERRLMTDKILARITTAEDIVVRFQEAVDEQVKRRKILIQEQRIPISDSLIESIRDLREILHGPEANMPRSNRSSVARESDSRRHKDTERTVKRDPWFFR